MPAESILLAETLPQSIIASLKELPNRLLFQNDCVQLVLVGLRRAQELEHFHNPASLLMVVTFGRVLVRNQECVHKLDEGAQIRIEPQYLYHIRALETADLLFFIPQKGKVASDLLPVLDRQLEKRFTAQNKEYALVPA